MKITALIENTSSSLDIISEHGLSLFIETEGQRILFDMGQSDAFIKNALSLGIDLADVDVAVISHGHYDHGGGLRYFLELNRSAPIYVHKDAFLPHYNGTSKYIGLDAAFKSSPRIIFTDDKLNIGKGLTLLTCNGQKRVTKLDSAGLNELSDGLHLPEDFRHEQFLLIEEKGKSTLISGCSHKGIIDIVEWIHPNTVVGGFHFSKRPLDDKLTEDATTLQKSGVRFFTCHCTGVEQFDLLKEHMTQLEYLSAGQTVEL